MGTQTEVEVREAVTALKTLTDFAQNRWGTSAQTHLRAMLSSGDIEDYIAKNPPFSGR